MTAVIRRVLIALVAMAVVFMAAGIIGSSLAPWLVTVTMIVAAVVAVTVDIRLSRRKAARAGPSNAHN